MSLMTKPPISLEDGSLYCLEPLSLLQNKQSLRLGLLSLSGLCLACRNNLTISLLESSIITNPQTKASIEVDEKFSWVNG